MVYGLWFMVFVPMGISNIFESPKTRNYKLKAINYYLFMLFSVDLLNISPT